MTDRRIYHEQADAMHSFVGAEAEHKLQDRRIRGQPLAVRHRVDEPGGGHNFEALVDADQEFGRNDLALDRTELHALGLTLDRAQLACRIDFGR